MVTTAERLWTGATENDRRLEVKDEAERAGEARMETGVVDTKAVFMLNFVGDVSGVW